LEIIFLGTSAGTPTKTRNVSATAIRHTNAKSWCLVDCGEGTQHQILHTDLSLAQLKVIFITHVHGDHCYGLPGLLASASLTGRKNPLIVVAPYAVQEMFECVQRNSDLTLSYDICFLKPQDLTDNAELGGFTIETVELSHRVQCFAYIFTEKTPYARLNREKLAKDCIPAGPSWGKLERGEDVALECGRIAKAKEYLLPAARARKIIIAGDNDTPELLRKSCKHADVLVHEATYTQEVSDKVGALPQHCSAKKLAIFAESVMLPNLVLNHFSARYQEHGEHTFDDLKNEALAEYRGNLLLAKDFSNFRLNVGGLLNLNENTKKS
jgi:ribonuclease Z